MKLQLLVNHYQEPNEIVARFLNSVKFQENISFDDIQILIYTDGEENTLDLNFLNSFNLPIIYKVLPHRGVCVTRNALLDASSAEYIMFCDIDDCFNSTLGLYKLLTIIEKMPNINVIGSYYDEEYYVNEEYKYLLRKNDTIRLHGKVFKRKYIIKNNIRFPDEILFSGDMFFLWLAYNLEPKTIWLPQSFYSWRYNPNSVTRKEKYHNLKTYHIMLRNYELLLINLFKRNRNDLICFLVCAIMDMIYLNDTNENFMKGPIKDIISARSAMYKFIKKYKKIYDSFKVLDYKKKSYESAIKIHPPGKDCKGFEGLQPYLDEKELV